MSETEDADGYCEHLSPDDEQAEEELEIEHLEEVEELEETEELEEEDTVQDQCEVEEDPLAGELSDGEVVPQWRVLEHKSLPRKEKKIECTECKKLVKASAMNTHMSSKHSGPRFFCEVCDAGFPFQAMLKIHKASHKKLEDEGEDYPVKVNCCHMCDKKFRAAESLRDHLKRRHGLEWQKGAHYSCRECRKPFTEFFHVRMHLMLYHNIELPKKYFKKTGIYTCELCKFTVKSEHQLRLHLRASHNLSNNQMESLKEACEACGRRFSMRINLINHINSAHRHVKPLECEFCGDRFCKYSSLIMHRRRHTGEKPFKCCVCDKTYRQRNDVLRHLARHVRDNEIPFQDAYATNTSPSKRVFMRHIFLKHSTQKGIADLAFHDPVKKIAKAPKGHLRYQDDEEDEDDDDDSMDFHETPRIPRGVMKSEVVEENGVDEEYIINEEGNMVVENGEEIVDAEIITDSPEEYIQTGENTYTGADGSTYALETRDDGSTYLVKIEDDAEVILSDK